MSPDGLQNRAMVRRQSWARLRGFICRLIAEGSRFECEQAAHSKLHSTEINAHQSADRRPEGLFSSLVLDAIMCGRLRLLQSLKQRRDENRKRGITWHYSHSTCHPFCPIFPSFPYHQIGIIIEFDRDFMRLSPTAFSRSLSSLHHVTSNSYNMHPSVQSRIP